jgi:hypothetical protein
MAMQESDTNGFVFVSCGRGAGQGTVYRGEDSDTASFTSVLSLAGQGRSSIAVAPSNQAIVYIMAAQRSNGGGPGAYGLHGIYRSTAHGDVGTFVTRRQGNVAPPDLASRINQLLLSNPVIALLQECGYGSTSQYLNQGWYDNVLAVDPVDPNRVWAGGIDLWRSDDAGANWGTASYWWFTKGVSPQYAHADQHGIVFHPGYDGVGNRIMFAASDGGIARIDNARAPVNTTLAQLCGSPVAGAAAWTDRSNGYVTTQFYDGVPYPDGQAFFGGLQDNGTMRGSAGNTAWGVLAGGDGGYVAVDTLGDATPGNDVLFLANTGNSMKRSIDGGVSFTDVTAGIVDNGMLFIAPFAMNEGNRQQLWTGGYSLWRTTDHAATWTRATGANETCGNGSVSAIAVHPADGNRVLVGMSDGCYHYHHAALTAPDSGSWPGGTYLTGGTTQGLGLISWMAWHPTDLNVAYATISAFGVPNLLKTTDGGQTWAPSAGAGATALPQIPALSVVVNPVSPNQVHVGTDLGVFTSLDAGASWLLEAAGFPNTPVEALKFDDSVPPRLFAFTHGRGAFSVGTGCPVITVSPATIPDGFVGGSYDQTLSAIGGSTPYTFDLAAGTLPTGLTLGSSGTLTGTTAAGGTYTFTVRVTDAASCTGAHDYTVTVRRRPSVTSVTFESGPFTYRGIPFTATALVTGGDGLNLPVPVTYGGDCTNVSGSNGCTASATFAQTTTHEGSTATDSITILAATAHATAQPASAVAGDSSVVLQASLFSPTAMVNEGAVEFAVRQGATPIGAPISGVVTAGAASVVFPIPAGTPAGAYTVTPTYIPGSNFIAGAATAGTLTIAATCPAIAIGPPLLPAGVFGAPYAQALSATGGEAPYTFTIVEGALPAGFALTAGTMAGTPSAATSSSFTVQVTDANGCVGAAQYQLDIARASTTTTVLEAVAPWGAASVALTATVASPTALVGEGTVVFTVRQGATTIGTSVTSGPVVAGTAQAVFALPGGTPPGHYALDAVYVPGPNFTTATAAAATLTVSQPVDPQPPTGLMVDHIAGNRVRVRWTPPAIGPAPTAYVLEGGVARGDVLAVLPTGSASPVLDLDVPNGAYYARVHALVAGERSAASNEVPLLVNVPVPPSAPVAFTGAVHGTTLDLAWRQTFAGGVATGAVLEVSGDVNASVALPPGEHARFAGVPGGVYTLRLRATNAAGSSPATPSITLAVPSACAGAPLPPERMLAYRVGSTVTVIWDPPASGAAPSSYLLQVSGAFTAALPLTARAVSAAAAPGQYTVSVVAVNDCGASAATAPQTIVVP